MATMEALVVVAHPDDETLWVGGTILLNPKWRWTVVSLCRGGDPDRAPKFSRAVDRLGARGIIGDLDDGPEQAPLESGAVEAAALAMLQQLEWNVVFTHSPFGEYTRHRRHEEVGRAVTALWARGGLVTGDLRLFAYEDGGRQYYPRAIEQAHIRTELAEETWRAKRRLIEDVYGFSADSWEAGAVGRVEAFWRFRNAGDYQAWIKAYDASSQGGIA
jgi:LmbE family N-acetylglucosaminyl deacetylase